MNWRVGKPSGEQLSVCVESFESYVFSVNSI